MFLSKSKYCSAVQCPKMLWLLKNRKEEFDDSVMNESILEQGNEVGDLAMGLLGHFTEVPYGAPSEMLVSTEKLLLTDEKVIAEASFAYEGLFCSVDILERNDDGSVNVYEVKSSTQVNDIYYYDVAYQVYVLRKLGIQVRKASLVHINNQYVRHGEVDIHELFTVCDITEKIMDLQDDTENRLRFLETYMSNTEEPVMDIDIQCFGKYKCGYWKYCSGNLPRPNVFDLTGTLAKTKLKLYKAGSVSFTDLEKNIKLNKKILQQIRHELHEPGDEINRDAIREALGKFCYPLYFLDFETFQTAVPLYDDMRPYEQIPFQYSLHYIENEGGELRHTEHLAWPGHDPRRDLAEQLCRDIPADACVLAYNMSFEKGVIQRLAGQYPDLSDHLLAIHDHIQDLMIPFEHRDYYNKRMQGSYSIKYVLPALFPDDPELDYHNLEGVHNGQEATQTYLRMAKMEPDELNEWRGHLLKYCGLDTYAMVKVWQKLNSVLTEARLSGETGKPGPLKKV